MSLPTHLTNNASQLPFYCSSNSLIFYLGKIKIIFSKFISRFFPRWSRYLLSGINTLQSIRVCRVLQRLLTCFFLRYQITKKPLSYFVFLSSTMHSSTNIFYCRTTRRNSSTTFSWYVRTKVYELILFIFLKFLELYVFLIHHLHHLIRMLYIKFVYNISIVEKLKIL
jgi:hypothetical protein